MPARIFPATLAPALSLVLLLPCSSLSAPKKEAPPPANPIQAALGNLTWRNVGPGVMGGRVADIEGVPGDPNLVYVGSASGGVWKTVDGGATWKPLFDEQPVASIGDLALEPGNPEVIYVGTGESNVRNSVSFGNGVYKSSDGGKSWRHSGLEHSEHISRILVNPRDPQRVYVGALGRIYGPHPERGVFMSVDAGGTWEKVLFVDDRHGVSDLEIDPQNPNLLYAGMWRFERKPWTHTSGSEAGGVFRSVDGGRTWKKLDKGLPKQMGRIGIKVAPSNPKLVYVLAESNEGTLFRSIDGGDSFEKVSDKTAIVSRGFYYTDLRVDPVEEDRVYAVAARLWLSTDGGKSFRTISRKTHGDYHSLWIDPRDPRRLWQAQDGGIAVSYDRGSTWEHVDNFPLAQFYQIYADNRQPFYYLGGGLQDNGSWYGPSRTREPRGILNLEWRTLSGGDGYFVAVHPSQPELFLSEYQGGGILRTDMRTREQQDVSPQPRRNDGGPAGELKYRFNWNAPIVPSPHDPETVYFAGNMVFKSTDFGLTWTPISPDLTTDDPAKQGDAGGPIWVENTTAEYHCTVISIAESPAEAGVLWAGTDDGKLQLSRDGGVNWTDLTSRLPSIPAHSPVSHVEPSRFAAGTAYVSLERHMFDDFGPYVLKTTDFGATWTNLTGDLPDQAYVHVVREDPKNPALLYAGTELGLYASHVGGRSWTRLHLKNLPTVAVHDMLIHPRENDLILGTHGRGLWIFDDASPLQGLSPEILSQTAHLFPARPSLRFRVMETVDGMGEKPFGAENPPYGALLTYHLKAKPEKEAPLMIEILDQGKVIKQIKKLPAEPGLNRVAWDLSLDAARPRKDPDEDRPLGDYGESDEPKGPQALPGRYVARLTVGTTTLETPIEVRLDPTVTVPAEGLAAQFAAAVELRDLESEVNDALRGLDEVQAQLGERKKLLASRKAPEALLQALEAELKAAAAQAEKLAKPEEKRYWAAGPKISERLSDLFGGINGSNAAPTAPQKELLAELRAETRAAMAEVRRYYAEALGALNAKLRADGYPEVSVPPEAGRAAE